MPTQPNQYEGVKNPLSLLTVEEAAEFLRVHPATVYRWVRRKRNGLPAYRIGARIYRINRDELLRWAQTKTVKKAQEAVEKEKNHND